MTAPRLQSPSPQPEKILLAGAPGSGKTHAIVDVAKKCLGDGQTMTIVDTESHVPVLLEAAGIVPDQTWWGDELVDEGDDDTGIKVVWARDWVEERAAIKGALENAGRGDWVCVDSITPPWADVQSWWVGEVTGGEEYGDWYARIIKEGRDTGKRDEGAGAQLGEWKIINSQWNTYVLKPLMRTSGHLLVTSHVKSINPEHDGAGVKGIWGPFRAKADTQKQVAHLVRTVVGVERVSGAGGGWVATVLKDQGRTEPGDVPRVDMKSFALDYLKGVAGWQMKR